MKSKQSLNALIAKRVMNEIVLYEHAYLEPITESHYGVTPKYFIHKHGEYYDVPDYAGDVTETMVVWEKLKEMNMYLEVTTTPTGHCVLLRDGVDGKVSTAVAESLPHAICLAAVKGLEGK